MTTQKPERCELSDLPADQCGCRKHRPGVSIIDVEERSYPGATYIFDLLVEAQYEGRCHECHTRIMLGEHIVPQRYRGENTGRWAHKECGREAS